MVLFTPNATITYSKVRRRVLSLATAKHAPPMSCQLSFLTAFWSENVWLTVKISVIRFGERIAW